MKKTITFLVCALFIAALSSSTTTAQFKDLKIGKKFTVNQADQLFGKVKNSVTISKAELKAAVAKADKFVYFAIRNNKAYVLDGRKISLLDNQSFTLGKNEVVYVFSKSVVEDFLNSTTNLSVSSSKTGTANISTTGSETITLEQREGVFTLSDGASTLEMSYACPPICG
ncbi:MAG: hypothetical protein AB1521_17500 [Bacteroidota bacterium]